MASARFSLPFLVAGQTRKEVFHNEALQALEFFVQPVIADIGANQPPVSAKPGDLFIVGSDPGGAWQGHAGELAMMIDGGWRFQRPFEGIRATLRSTSLMLVFKDGAWRTPAVAASSLVVEGQQVVGRRADAIAVPAGGGVVDSECRAAVTLILSALQQHGLINS